MPQNDINNSKLLGVDLSAFVDEQTVHSEQSVQVQEVIFPMELVYCYFGKSVWACSLCFIEHD